MWATPGTLWSCNAKYVICTPQLYFIFGWLQVKRCSVDSYSLQWGHSELPLAVISLLAPVGNQLWINIEIIVLANPDFALKAMVNANQCILAYSNAILCFLRNISCLLFPELKTLSYMIFHCGCVLFPITCLQIKSIMHIGSRVSYAKWHRIFVYMIIFGSKIWSRYLVTMMIY